MTSSGGYPPTIWQLSPVELDILKSDVHGYVVGLQVTHVAFLASATVLLWDIIITWDQEIRRVWRDRWSIAKVIFLLNRYWAPVTFLALGLALFWVPGRESDCFVLAWIIIVFFTICGTVASFVLASRLWALYEQDRRVLAVLIIGFVVCLSPAWVLTCKIGFDAEQYRILGNVSTYIASFIIQNGYEQLDWRFKRCFHFKFGKVSSAIVIGSLTYESGIFFAMLWKMHKDKHRTRILQDFYHDGILYYLVIFCSYAVALGAGLAWHNDPAQYFVTSAYYLGIKSTMCSHIILRLRSYFAHTHYSSGRVNTGESTTGEVSTVIMFAPPGEGEGEEVLGMGASWRTMDLDARNRPPTGGEGRETRTSWAAERLSLEISSTTHRPKQPKVTLERPGDAGRQRLDDQSLAVTLEMEILDGIVSNSSYGERAHERV